MNCGDSSMIEHDLFQDQDGGLIPASPLQLSDIFITVMQKAHANRIFVEHHYAHRAVPISECYGAWVRNGKGRSLVGAISFGKPASYTLCNGICGKENSKRIYELNRLWMADNCPKNSESMFIGRALKFISIKHPDWVIVSYADSEQGYTGTIYRASNFLYTGKTKPHILYDNGTGKHGRHIKCEGDKTYQRSVKYRYVYFFNKDDVRLLKYPIIKYITTANQHDKGER